MMKEMKILIIKTSSLGDIIQTFPVLDYLRHHFPHAQIDWVVEHPFIELVKANTQVNSVISIESKRWRRNLFKKKTRISIRDFRNKLRKTTYDLTFDLQGNIKSGLILWLVRSQKKIGFGWSTAPEWPNCLFTSRKFNPEKGRNIREDYLAIVQKYFQDSKPHLSQPQLLRLEPIQEQQLASLFSEFCTPILVCPGSAWPNKCLETSQLRKILEKLNSRPYWFVWGSLQEREAAVFLSSCFPGSKVLEKLSLPLLQHVMARSQLVIAMDSLPLHLCGTTLTPSLSFFGPSSASKFRPLGEKQLFIQGKCPYDVQFEKRCPKLRTCPTGACLKNHEILSQISAFSLE